MGLKKSHDYNQQRVEECSRQREKPYPVSTAIECWEQDLGISII